jgi:hypothetical protein
MKPLHKILLIVLLSLFIFLAAAYGTALWLLRTERVVKWNDRYYFQSTLDKAYPQTITVKAKNKPEDAYYGFRNTVLAGDYEGAMEFVKEEHRERFKSILANDNERAVDSIRNMPENFSNWSMRNENEYIKSYEYTNKNDNKVILEIDLCVDGMWRVRRI